MNAVVLSWKEQKQKLSENSFVFYREDFYEHLLNLVDFKEAFITLGLFALALYLIPLVAPEYSLSLATCLYILILLIFAQAAGLFLFYAADLLLLGAFAIFLIALLPFEARFFYELFTVPQPNLVSYFLRACCSIFVLLFAIIGITLLYLFTAGVGAVIRTLKRDRDRQAHLLFLLSMAALGSALWLQSGGNWQSMAALNVPISIPGFFTIPNTEILNFPFALLGLIDNPVGSAVSAGAHSSLNQALLLLAVSLGFFFLASNVLSYSPEVPQPVFVWLALALCAAAVCVDISFHWYGASLWPPYVILFNRAFAILAGGVYLFWRSKGKKGFPVPGASGEFQLAFEMADQSARRIALWLLGFVVVATQSSIVLKGELPEWSITVGVVIFTLFPFRYMTNFKREFDEARGRYDELRDLSENSYSPPSTVATDEQVRDALNGGRQIGGDDWEDDGE